MGQRYAVLISGDLAENGYPEFFFDVVLMREMLIGNGFPANHIFVLYGDGADYNSANYPAARYRPNPAITDLSATMANVQAIFSDLANGTNGRPQLTDDDLLFVWTFDHGSQIPISPGSATLISTLGLRGGDMRVDDFATAINLIPHAFRIICMQQCRSGGFIPHLATDRTVIVTAAEADRNAHPTDDVAERETIGGRIYPHGEFNFYLLAALNGQNLLGNAANADANGDGFTTMGEVFDYIVNHESDSATPQYDDGSRHLGERLHLIHVANTNTKEIHIGYCYWVTQMADSNKAPCSSLEELATLVRESGYNGCFYCLPRYDRDTLSEQQVLANLEEDLTG